MSFFSWFARCLRKAGGVDSRSRDWNFKLVRPLISRFQEGKGDELLQLQGFLRSKMKRSNNHKGASTMMLKFEDQYWVSFGNPSSVRGFNCITYPYHFYKTKANTKRFQIKIFIIVNYLLSNIIVRLQEMWEISKSIKFNRKFLIFHIHFHFKF